MNKTENDMQLLYIESFIQTDEIMHAVVYSEQQDEPIHLIICLEFLNTLEISLIKPDKSIWVDGFYKYDNFKITKILAHSIQS